MYLWKNWKADRLDCQFNGPVCAQKQTSNRPDIEQSEFWILAIKATCCVMHEFSVMLRFSSVWEKCHLPTNKLQCVLHNNDILDKKMRQKTEEN